MFSRRRISIGIGIAAVLLAVVFLWPWAVQRYYEKRIYTVADVPPGRVAIVFGAAVYRDGRLSAMLRDRVETAIRLYEAGKVGTLIFTGDNSAAHYNEPAAMMRYAVERGVPASAIQPDYGGLRTYDSCYRARDIFGVESAILVTQEFHLPRALFTCDRLGIETVGVAADLRSYGPRSIGWSRTREVPALLVALLDVVRHQPPPIMGEPIQLP